MDDVFSWQKIASAVLVAVLVAIPTAYLTVYLAFIRYKFEKWWDSDTYSVNNAYEEGTPLYWADIAWQAAIEHYKASLVPVAYIHRNDYNEYRLEPTDAFKVTDIPKNVDIPLYALG